MHKLSDSTLVVGSLLALLAAFACSSEPDGSKTVGPVVTPFGSPPPGTDTTTNPNQPATNGTVMGTPGTGEQPITPVNGTGMNTGAMGTAGSGATAPALDTAPQEVPRGYFKSGGWSGFAWTGGDTQGLATFAPANFSALPKGSPFCFEGTVRGDPPTSPTANDGYQGVALLGFNVNQELFGPTEGVAPPTLETVPTEQGVAINFTRNAPPAGMNVTTAPLLRIQLQNLAGKLWCADLPTVNGAGFIPYSGFRTNCWESPPTAASVAYAREPVSAVVLTVPGGGIAGQDFYYNVCMAGFADGNSPADAPTEISLGEGVLSGTLATQFARAKVSVDGESYVINANAWGDNSRDGTQRLRYTNNSFEILQQSAGVGANSSPASFPSIYIGSNGLKSGVNGATTADTDKLPIQNSAIVTLPTTFRHNATNGDFNATYDVWFAPNGTPGQYDTAQAAFLMVWTYKPQGRVAIGNRTGPFMVDNRPWYLYVGPRGSGGPDNNLPVISYVNEGPAITNYSFDLNVFIKDAIARNVGLTNNMFLTDVFAGFEIWGGGAGLRVDEFKAVVNP
jgi:hypothetical protein